MRNNKKSGWLKRICYRKEYAEYLNVEQALRTKQRASTRLFVQVKEDEERSTGTDPELNRVNEELSALAKRLVELRKIFEPQIKHR